MTGQRVALVFFATAVFVAATTSVASAQYIGTFRWQLAPFCNVVTLDAVQQVSTIALSGFDDQCGAPVAAAATGTAFLNPNGIVSLAVSVTRPDGIVISTSAEVSLATVSGPWKDDGGNSGTFVFSPASPAGGSPRLVTLKGIYSAGFTAATPGEEFVTQFSFGGSLPAPPASLPANQIPFGGAPTANCPGSFANPQAVPGQLCLYERATANAGYFVVDSAFNRDVADTLGASLYVVAAAPGLVGISGVWAVSIP